MKQAPKQQNAPVGSEQAGQDWRESFQAYYAQHIAPLAQEFEVRRRTALVSIKKRRNIAVGIALALGALGLPFFASLPFEPLIFGCLAYVAVAYIVTKLPAMAYSLDVKTKIFPKVLGFLGDFRYNTTVPYSVRQLRDWGLVPSFDKERNEDYITGSYLGVGIELFESTLEDESTDSKGNTTTTTVFRGIFVRFVIPKRFKGRTIIRRDQGKLGNWLNRSFSNLSNVALEDPSFEKLFEVYSDDQVEARYLVTTAFMQRLLDLQSWFGKSCAIECSFYDQSILLKINCHKDLFEPGSVYKPVDFMADAERFFQEFRLVFAVIHALKLNAVV